MKQSQVYTRTLGLAATLCNISKTSPIFSPEILVPQVAKLLAWIRREPADRLIAMIPRIIATTAFELVNQASCWHDG